MQIKQTIWLVNPTEPQETWHYRVSDIDMSTEGWYNAKDVVIEFSPPSREEVVPVTIQACEKRIVDIQAKAQEHIATLRGEIANLLALTNDTQNANGGA